MPDCYDFYLWSIGKMKIAPPMEYKLLNELKINRLISRGEDYE